MREPEPPATLSYQVLADPTGRRRRLLAIAGRVATAALGLWLVVLVLGGLGLQPLAGLPIVGGLGAREDAPPALPLRVQAAVAEHTTVAPSTEAVRVPVTSVSVPLRPPAVTAPSRGKTRPQGRVTPLTRKTTPGRGLTSPRLAPSRPTTSPSTAAPGQTRTAPGQTRTESGPPTSTPGTTPGGNGKPRANGTVTTP